MNGRSLVKEEDNAAFLFPPFQGAGDGSQTASLNSKGKGALPLSFNDSFYLSIADSLWATW